MKDLISVFTKLVKTLEENNFEYMLVGSLASMVYGEPRMTKDFDIVIEIEPKNLQNFYKLFDFKEYYIPPYEVLSQELINRGCFNLIHHNTGYKIDFMFRKNNAHSIEEFNRKTKLDFIEGVKVFIASPEDVIIKKLLFFKEGMSFKHIDDIKGILANSSIDFNYLNKWLQNLNLEDLWKTNFSNL